MINKIQKPDSASPASDIAVLSELESHREHHQTSTKLFTFHVVAGLVMGLVGGVLGSAFVYPWYQENILDQGSNNSSMQETQTGTRVVLDEESAVISAVEKVDPAVVSIVVTKDLPAFEQFGSPFGGFLFEIPSGETESQQVGAGSGFIITENGMIVTNKHVVDDTAAEYTVITKDNQKYPATVVATDPFNDLAIVKIEATNLATVSLADSAQLKLGQKVIAIGNALGEFQNTITVGVVSGIGRNITATGGTQTEKLSELIQTDAAINPGNSGGPLVNLDGEVVGVNTAISQSAQLIGFAIPANQIKKVVDDVQEFGRVRRPFLGVRYMIVTESLAESNDLAVDYGALIIRGDDSSEPAVIPDSPAARAGLVAGDIILEMDSKKITTDLQLADILRNYSPGARVFLKVLSNAEERTVSVTLDEAQ